MRVKDYLNEYNLPQGRIRKVKKEFKEYVAGAGRRSHA